MYVCMYVYICRHVGRCLCMYLHICVFSYAHPYVRNKVVVLIRMAKQKGTNRCQISTTAFLGLDMGDMFFSMLMESGIRRPKWLDHYFPKIWQRFAPLVAWRFAFGVWIRTGRVSIMASWSAFTGGLAQSAFIVATCSLSWNVWSCLTIVLEELL